MLSLRTFVQLILSVTCIYFLYTPFKVLFNESEPRVVTRNFNETSFNIGTTKITPNEPSVTKLAVVVVFSKAADVLNYSLAQKTLECYCKLKNYTYYQIILERDENLRSLCPQKDFSFQRHCVTIHLLRSNPEIPYLLFMDADMGVVNPNHFIESYIDPEYDLLFYERIESSEITAGTYIIKNTPYALNFLQAWVDYEKKPLISVADKDSEALYELLFERFSGLQKKIWRTKYYYHVCVRFLLGKNEFDRIKIFPKNLTNYLVRDAWLTNSKFSTNDFIIQGWNDETLGQSGSTGWQNPFLNKTGLEEAQCAPEADNTWKYDEQHFVENIVIENALKNYINFSNLKYATYTKQLQGIINKNVAF